MAAAGSIRCDGVRCGTCIVDYPGISEIICERVASPQDSARDINV